MTNWIGSVLIFSALPVGASSLKALLLSVLFIPTSQHSEQWFTQCWQLSEFGWLWCCSDFCIQLILHTDFGFRMACPLNYQYYSILCIIYPLKVWPVCCCCFSCVCVWSLLLLFRDLLNLYCISNKYKW